MAAKRREMTEEQKEAVSAQVNARAAANATIRAKKLIVAGWTICRHDEKNFCLEKLKEEGKPAEHPRYYPDIPSALKVLYRQSISSADADLKARTMDLKSHAELIQRTENRILAALGISPVVEELEMARP